jgi:hypothetical protein
LGDTDSVVTHYLAAMTEKDSAYVTTRKQPVARREGRFTAPEVVDRIPNIDHRHGDGRAEVIGIAVLSAEGRPLHLLEPSSRLTVRISVRAKTEIGHPNVGFMLRNHLGIDFSGTNTSREGVEIPPMFPGDVYTVDFHIDMPELYPAFFSFSPAIADGTHHSYVMCDWIDNAVTLQMGHGEGQVYGYIHLPCRVAVNEPLSQNAPAPEINVL